MFNHFLRRGHASLKLLHVLPVCDLLGSRQLNPALANGLLAQGEARFQLLAPATHRFCVSSLVGDCVVSQDVAT